MRDHALELRHSGKFSDFPGHLELSERQDWRHAQHIQGAIKDEIKRNKILPSTIEVLIREDWIYPHKIDQWGMNIYYLSDEGAISIRDLSDKAFVSTRKANKAISVQFMIEALKLRYPRERGWLVFTEVTFAHPKHKNSRRIDVLLFNYYYSKNYLRIACEIKRARSNFLQELREPEKRVPVMKMVNEFYYVAPKDLIKPEEIPDDCGLIEVDDNGVCRVKVKAPFLGDPPPNWYLIGTILRSFYDNVEEYTEDSS